MHNFGFRKGFNQATEVVITASTRLDSLEDSLGLATDMAGQFFLQKVSDNAEKVVWNFSVRSSELGNSLERAWKIKILLKRRRKQEKFVGNLGLDSNPLE